MPQNIHPSAIVEDGAHLGDNVTIEPFAVIRKNVCLGDNVVIKAHAYIEGNTTIGDNTVIYSGACIGTSPQSYKYKGEKTYVEIGQNCQIREYVTINSSTGENSIVRIGNNCMIMAYCHIAHNCTLGNHVIISNYSGLAGHVEIEDFVIIGGKTPVHQYVRIGAYAMVGGFSGVGQDIPPYTIGGGIPYRFGGLNLVGLKRHGFPLDVRQELTRAFKLVYRSKLKLKDALDRIEEELRPLPEVHHWLAFCRNSKRGLIALGGVVKQEQELLDKKYLEQELEEVGELVDLFASN